MLARKQKQPHQNRSNYLHIHIHKDTFNTPLFALEVKFRNKSLLKCILQSEGKIIDSHVQTVTMHLTYV